MIPVYIKSYKSPLGELTIGSYQNKICLCDWTYRKMRTTIDNRIKQGLKTEFFEGTTPVIEETISQLNEYFHNTRKTFSIPLMFVGTSFQRSVWEALLTIPYGKTSSYLNLSKQLGNEKAIRAVAAANGANSISILVPCHRIIGSDGNLIGYAGGLSAKMKLLELEGAIQKPKDLFSELN